jgi:glycosyltransferase involved in cell wall biosynthesis
VIATAAPARCAVIVPVMRRPHRVAPLIESLRNSTDDARIVFVADHDDTDEIDAIYDAGAYVVINHGDVKTFAAKVNIGYRATSEPWLLFVGDDVEFHLDWLEAAIDTAGDTWHLIATNDLRNQAVMAGQHATHPLMRRTWIDTHGASWDGPGTVAHEGYRHWYVDNEWTCVAQHARVFNFAFDSIIEHHHPIWDPGVANDDVYELGQRNAQLDHELFAARYRKHCL